MITVGIIEYNRPDLTQIAIDSARQNAGMDFKLLLIVNSSGTEKKLTGYDHMIVNERNEGFSEASNQILEYDEANDVVLLNSDTQCGDDWLLHLHNFRYFIRNLVKISILYVIYI